MSMKIGPWNYRDPEDTGGNQKPDPRTRPTPPGRGPHINLHNTWVSPSAFTVVKGIEKSLVSNTNILVKITFNYVYA